MCVESRESKKKKSRGLEILMVQRALFVVVVAFKHGGKTHLGFLGERSVRGDGIFHAFLFYLLLSFVVFFLFVEEEFSRGHSDWSIFGSI